MARAPNRLSAVEVKAIGDKGMYHDGGRAVFPGKSWRSEIVRGMTEVDPKPTLPVAGSASRLGVAVADV